MSGVVTVMCTCFAKTRAYTFSFERQLALGVEERYPPPTVFCVWVEAVLAARRSARQVISLRRALLVARVSN